MFELLRKKITQIVKITDEEFEFVASRFTNKNLRKKQFLLQEGEICKSQAFVVQGIMRSYTIDDKGNEHILQFASEGWWMADLSSYLNETPSRFNMEAVEEVQLLLLTKPSWNLLMEKLPILERFFRVLVQNHLVATQNRLMESLSEQAEEKYLNFIDTYPDCVARVPQHMIAAYLGISRETLSRLRKHLAVRR
jgi:CRP-like cAMP-binding protein